MAGEHGDGWRAAAMIAIGLAFGACDADGAGGGWFVPGPPSGVEVSFVPSAPVLPTPVLGRQVRIAEVRRPPAALERLPAGAGEVLAPSPITPSVPCAPTWTQQVLEVSAHVPDQAAPFDHVGLAIGLADGWLVAGADGDDEAGLDAGAAWVYHRTEARSWEVWEKLVGAGPHHHFGWSVDADGDQVAIGAPGEGAGTVHLYERVCGGWAEGAPLVVAETNDDAQFGASVRLHDGRLAVGAPGDDGDGDDAGAAWIFEEVDGAWQVEARLASVIAGPGRGFGTSVALFGDLAVVGAPEHGAGVVHLFRSVEGAWVEEATVRANDLGAGARFGAAVDSDGATLIVGAESLTAGGLVEVGGAFVFTRTHQGWGQRRRLMPRDAKGQAHFGVEVRLSAGVAAVGAWQAATHQGATGAVYLFAKTKAGWLERTKLVDAGGDEGDRLGLGIAIDGGVLATGAWSADTRGPDAGKVLIFDDGACDSAPIADISPCSPAP